MKNERNLSDEQLVKIAIRDKEQFREIIRRYEKKISSYAYYLTGNRAESADITQEVFIKTYVNLNGFDVKKKFSSWIFRIAHNESVNLLKKNFRWVSHDDRDIKSDQDIEKELVDSEIRKILGKCLDKIPLHYKEVVTLYYFENLSYQDISDILQIPENTVATYLSRAKSSLKIICQKEKI